MTNEKTIERLIFYRDYLKDSHRTRYSNLTITEMGNICPEAERLVKAFDTSGENARFSALQSQVLFRLGEARFKIRKLDSVSPADGLRKVNRFNEALASLSGPIELFVDTVQENQR